MIVKNILLILFICSCITDTSTQKRLWEITDAARMPFTISESPTVYVGIASVQRQSSHTITFRPRNKVRDFSIWTCAREIFFTEQLKEYKYTYIPTFDLENQGVCPLFAYAVSEAGQQELAVISFNNGDKLKLRIYCNGSADDHVGASICQLRAGLVMAIRTSERIAVEPGDASRCPKPTELSPFRHELVMPEGYCTYTFRGNASGDFFTLTTRGYVRQ